MVSIILIGNTRSDTTRTLSSNGKQNEVLPDGLEDVSNNFNDTESVFYIDPNTCFTMKTMIYDDCIYSEGINQSQSVHKISSINVCPENPLFEGKSKKTIVNFDTTENCGSRGSTIPLLDNTQLGALTISNSDQNGVTISSGKYFLGIDNNTNVTASFLNVKWRILNTIDGNKQNFLLKVAYQDLYIKLTTDKFGQLSVQAVPYTKVPTTFNIVRGSPFFAIMSKISSNYLPAIICCVIIIIVVVVRHFLKKGTLVEKA